VSDFKINSKDRVRLLSGDFRPLTFETKPFGCEPGAMYVLARKRASATAYADGSVVCIPEHPVWWITVTKVQRVVKGDQLGWSVRFEVTDRRDSDLWLSHDGDYQWTARGAVDPLPVVVSDEVRAKAIAERDHLARLKRHAEEQKKKVSRLRERSEARRKRAA
jgi:hypothetical protein